VRWCEHARALAGTPGLWNEPAFEWLTLQNKRVVYGLLFRMSAETLLEIARDPQHLGAETVSLACCTAEIKNWNFTRISTASFLPANGPPITAAGVLAVAGPNGRWKVFDIQEFKPPPIPKIGDMRRQAPSRSYRPPSFL
jgi:hypothetical protein